MVERESGIKSNVALACAKKAIPATPARVTSRELLGDAEEIVIEHAGRDYRLRHTRNGKLILTA